MRLIDADALIEELHFCGEDRAIGIVDSVPTVDAILPRGTYQCFHCGSQSVVWQSDFSFEDYGMEGEGIIHVCHCANCGADIEYYVRVGDEDD